LTKLTIAPKKFLQSAPAICNMPSRHIAFNLR